MQANRDTAVDAEHRTTRVTKTTFKNGQKSEDSVSDYYFNSRSFLIRINTNVQAYDADEMQSVLMGHLKNSSADAVAGVMLMMEVCLQHALDLLEAVAESHQLHQT